MTSAPPSIHRRHRIAFTSNVATRSTPRSVFLRERKYQCFRSDDVRRIRSKETEQTDDDQVQRDDVIQKTRHDEDQNAGDQ